MEPNSKVHKNPDAEKASENKKLIWSIALMLLLAVFVTAAVFVSNVKKLAPTESDNVIALMPIDTEEFAEQSEVVSNPATDINVAAPDPDTSKETIQVQVPKSSGTMNTTYTSVRTEQRQVGLKKAEMQVEDEVQIWRSETEVDIFDAVYYGTENEITVESQDDANLIAPGTENDYTFWVKNTGEVGIDYWVSFEEKETEGYDIPLEVRVKCGNNYILGAKDEWEPIEKLNFIKHEGHLIEKNYAKYTLEWRWRYDNDDMQDTYLGNEAALKDIEQEIVIHTYGEGDDQPIYEWFTITDALAVFTGGVKTGDSAKTVIYIILILAALSAVIFLFVKRKKDEEEEHKN